MLLQERISRAVCHTRESEFRLKASLATPAVMVQGTLSGSGEDPWPDPRRGRQVPAAQEVPATKDNMGR